MKKIILGVALTVLSVVSFGQFEGVIEFTKTKGANTVVNYKYFVKGEKVRVEEIGEDGSINGIQLVDMSKNEILALSPDRKIYMEAPNNRPPYVVNTEASKTKSTKTINGVKCTKWVVKSTSDDRQIVYWVAKGDYQFFVPMLKTLNRKEKQSTYFLSVGTNVGFFPMMSEETTLSGGVNVSTLKTDKVTVKKLDDKLFVVPAGYKKFDR